ncbi:MAG: TrkA family potassium uptake protein [Lachnospiraceae bacterium]|nr:TrkA family potassium uptake protein [Lachnospiraceae bacterium]
MGSKNKKQYIVIGLGSFGSSVARTLIQNGCEVLVIDRDEEKTRAVADEVTCALSGDVRDPEMLSGLGLRNFDGAVVAIGADMESGIVATMLVKELGVPHIIAKAQNDLQGKILRKVGADRVVLPEIEMGVRYAANLANGNFFDAVELSEDVSMMEISVRRAWEGKSLRELNLRAKYKINVIGIKKEDGFDVNPDADEPLSVNDELVAIGRNEVLNRLAEGKL